MMQFRRIDVASLASLSDNHLKSHAREQFCGRVADPAMEAQAHQPEAAAAGPAVEACAVNVVSGGFDDDEVDPIQKLESQ